MKTYVTLTLAPITEDGVGIRVLVMKNQCGGRVMSAAGVVRVVLMKTYITIFIMIMGKNNKRDNCKLLQMTTALHRNKNILNELLIISRQ